MERSFFSLATMPAGGIVDGSGSPGFTTAYGRAAFFAPYDWAQLSVPTQLSGEAAFAVQFDFYVPAATTWDRAATVHLFSDPVAARAQPLHGMMARFLADAGGAFCVEHAIYAAGTPEWGWNLRAGTPGVCGSALPFGKTIPSFVDAWHTARIEGVRGPLCHIRIYLDGALVDQIDATCDVTGSRFVVGAWYGNLHAENVALSNLRIYQGNTAACVP